jgi:hypothetical protein
LEVELAFNKHANESSERIPKETVVQSTNPLGRDGKKTCQRHTERRMVEEKEKGWDR